MEKAIPGKAKSYSDLTEDDKIKMMKPERVTIIDVIPPKSFKAQVWEKVAGLEAKLSSLESENKKLREEMGQGFSLWTENTLKLEGRTEELSKRVEDLEKICQFLHAQATHYTPQGIVNCHLKEAYSSIAKEVRSGRPQDSIMRIVKDLNQEGK